MQCTMTEILWAPLQSNLERRPNGAVNNAMPFVATHRLSVWIWTPTTTSVWNKASLCPADIQKVAEFHLLDLVRDKIQAVYTKHL